MLKYYINLIICLFKKHVWENAGACPFTGKTYKVCTRCTVTEAI
jgi:hypothetical protein